MNADDADDLENYQPSWQTRPPVDPAPDTPATPPAYGQVNPIIDPEQPAQAVAPPPVMPQSPLSAPPSTIPNVIMVLAGTAYYTVVTASTTGPV